jgi:Hypothetical glycosyl hydrolase 6/Beta-galactosidase trimerisation domain
MTERFSRRKFLGGSAVAGTVLLSPLRSLATQPGASATRQAGWFDRPMRWAQLVLVENDPGRYDRDFWLDYFRRIHADAVNLSAGGYVAYYPTKIPLHRRSAWMGTSDPFGELVAGCRKLGMVVVARTDSHACHQDAYDAHPEWIAADADGNKRRHWSFHEAWVTCGLGPYNFEFMTEVHKEIVTLYNVDGIFTNRWAGSGMCYCESCRRNFKAACGMELPRTLDPHDPARRNYIRWRQDRLFELWKLWDSEIRKINPGARFIPNTGGGALSDLDMKTVGEMADTLFADRQARHGVMPPWAAGKNGKEFRAALGHKPVAGITSVGLEDAYRWKDSVQSEAELRIWMADGIANGMRPWFVKFSGTLYDRRWLKPVEEVFRWHHSAERYLRNTQSLARVAMVYSQQTGAFYGGEQAQEKVENSILGFYEALVEARIPFEMVHDGLLDAAHLDRFKTLFLPNIAALSDAQCDELRQYVRRGGSLVATFETSLYDEWGTRRTDFGLGDLFGAKWDGHTDGPMKNSYLRLQRDRTTGGYHPLLRGLEDAGRIVNGVRRVEVSPLREDFHSPLTLIPSYPDLPMEEVYPRQEETKIPGVFLLEQGKSRVVYFPWDIGRTFWEVSCVDHGRLLRNAVEWATAEEPPVVVAGPGMLDVTAWRQESSMTVHLVNLTNPMTMKGPYRELIPVGEQRVTVRLPARYAAKQVHLLRSGRNPVFEQAAGRLKVNVPPILDHEVVAIDL